jgi:hypothetical protein
VRSALLPALLLMPAMQVVLLVGCIALAVYTATQVFGWSGVLLSQQGASGYGVWAGVLVDVSRGVASIAMAI